MDACYFFEVVDEVDRTWRKVKIIPNYEEVLGVLIYRKIFELDPTTFELFPFKNVKPSELHENAIFRRHSRSFAMMLDHILNMFGPDMEPAECLLMELGSRHKTYGVSQEHYLIMGNAILKALEQLLGDGFTHKSYNAWKSIYDYITSIMVRSLVRRLESSSPQAGADPRVEQPRRRRRRRASCGY